MQKTQFIPTRYSTGLYQYEKLTSTTYGCNRNETKRNLRAKLSCPAAWFNGGAGGRRKQNVCQAMSCCVRRLCSKPSWGWLGVQCGWTQD